MAAARHFRRLAILPALLALGAAQPDPVLPQLHAAAQVALPPGCDAKRINQAIERRVIPDFVHCPFLLAQAFASRFDGRLRLDRKDAPDDSAAPGIVFKQDPQGGSPLQKDPVTLYVSTGPPPPPPPEPTPETPQPLPVGPVTVTPASAVAGQPLRFTVALQPAGVGGKVSYMVRAGSAGPGIDYTPVRGDLQLEPDADPLAVEVPTRPNADASSQLSLVLVVMDGKRVLGRAPGTITQPPAVALCPDGAEPPCATETVPPPPPPPPILCPDGTEEPCVPDFWHQVRDEIIDLLPMIATGLAVGLGAALTQELRPDHIPIPVPDPDPVPEPEPEPEPEPVPGAQVDFSAKPGAPAPPTLGASGAGRKGPIISLAWKSVRGETRVVSPSQTTESDDG